MRGRQIFFGNHGNEIYSIDAQTGQVQWKIEAGGAVISTPAAGKLAVYVTCADNTILCIR
jgi:outer membrane protein assembly factor BamB